jgi:hypothetical protein
MDKLWQEPDHFRLDLYREVGKKLHAITAMGHLKIKKYFSGIIIRHKAN